jgi:hypothetical protein
LITKADGVALCRHVGEGIFDDTEVDGEALTDMLVWAKSTQPKSIVSDMFCVSVVGDIEIGGKVLCQKCWIG